MATQRIEFEGHSGGKLAARLDHPDVAPRATALFAHCFTCSKDIAAARRISADLAELGFAVMRFDFTGLGHSEGEFANTNFSSNVEDLVRASGYLDSIGMAPSLLIGHSLGGAAVLKAASRIDSARAVVTIGAPANPGHVTHNFSGNLDDIEKDGEAVVSLGGRKFTIKKQFIDDIGQTSLVPAIANLRKALLVLHAPLDKTVGIENAAAIFQAARHPKSFVTLDDADHLITNGAAADYVASVIAAWSRKYIDQPEPVTAGESEEGFLRISEADPNGFRQRIETGQGHRLVADEPVAYGGTARGPTPYEYLSAGLGACTSMTIRLYARRKGWNLQHVSVDVIHRKIHAVDCGECESGGSGIDQFERTIRLAGELDDGQKSRLLAIADKCPVHKTLSSVCQVTTLLADR